MSLTTVIATNINRDSKLADEEQAYLMAKSGLEIGYSYFKDMASTDGNKVKTFIGKPAVESQIKDNSGEIKNIGNFDISVEYKKNADNTDDLNNVKIISTGKYNSSSIQVFKYLNVENSGNSSAMTNEALRTYEDIVGGETTLNSGNINGPIVINCPDETSVLNVNGRTDCTNFITNGSINVSTQLGAENVVAKGYIKIGSSLDLTGNLYSGGYIELGPSSTIKGSVYAEDYVIISANIGDASSIVKSEIKSTNSSVKINNGIIINADIYAEGDVIIGNGVTINGNIYTNGKVITGPMVMNGNIYANGDIIFGNGSRIYGSVTTTNGKVDFLNGIISGSVQALEMVGGICNGGFTNASGVEINNIAPENRFYIDDVDLIKQVDIPKPITKIPTIETGEIKKLSDNEYLIDNDCVIERSFSEPERLYIDASSNDIDILIKGDFKFKGWGQNNLIVNDGGGEHIIRIFFDDNSNAEFYDIMAEGKRGEPPFKNNTESPDTDPPNIFYFAGQNTTITLDSSSQMMGYFYVPDTIFNIPSNATSRRIKGKVMCKKFNPPSAHLPELIIYKEADESIYKRATKDVFLAGDS